MNKIIYKGVHECVSDHNPHKRRINPHRKKVKAIRQMFRYAHVIDALSMVFNINLRVYDLPYNGDSLEYTKTHFKLNLNKTDVNLKLILKGDWKHEYVTPVVRFVAETEGVCKSIMIPAEEVSVSKLKIDVWQVMCDLELYDIPDYTLMFSNTIPAYFNEYFYLPPIKDLQVVDFSDELTDLDDY